jgi:hypothetical protein
MKHCYYGDRQGRFEGRGWEFFKRGWRLWLMAGLPLILSMPMPLAKRIPGVPPGAEFIGGIIILVWILSAPSIYASFKAVEWRWWVSGIRFDKVSFESDLSSGALMSLYWKVIGWFVLVAVLLVVYMLACGWLIAGYSDLSSFAAQLRGSTRMLIASAIGYLAFILALNTVLRVYLLRDLWVRVAASTTAHNIEVVADVAVRGELAGAVGEGFSGNLDVVGF